MGMYSRRLQPENAHFQSNTEWRGNVTTSGQRFLPYPFEPSVSATFDHIKIVFYSTVDCTVAFHTEGAIGGYGDYGGGLIIREGLHYLKPGLNVFCRCKNFPVTRNICQYIGYNDSCKIQIIANDDPNILFIFCYKDETSKLEQICNANLAIQFRTKEEWEKVFQTRFSTHRSISKTILKSISCTEFQRAVVFYNLLGNHNNICSYSVRCRGHGDTAIHAAPYKCVYDDEMFSEIVCTREGTNMELERKPDLLSRYLDPKFQKRRVKVDFSDLRKKYDT
jgi:hypothetical protein